MDQTRIGGNSGPDLVRSVLVLHDQGTGKEIGPVIRNGRPGKGMPAFNFSDAQIKDIAGISAVAQSGRGEPDGIQDFERRHRRS